MSARPSIVLGISSFHGDSSAALVVNGKLVAAAEEERFKRIKHYALFPEQAIHYCLTHAGISPSEVEVIAVARRRRNALLKKLLLLWKNPSLIGASKRVNRTASPSIEKSLKQCGLGRARRIYVEHHLAHMMSSRFLSSSEHTAFFSFDGLGDFVSAAIGHSVGPSIEILDRVFFPHSLGFFYQAMTHYLGFPHFGDEFKVMGLSSYGSPRYLTAMRTLVRENQTGFGFELNLEAFPILKQPIQFYVENAQPYTDPFYSASFLTSVIGVPPRKKEPLNRNHWDLASSVQARFEEVADHCLRQLHDKVQASTVALSGGCAHNSVWVGKIPRNTPYRKVLVAAAANDAGIAVGAAIYAARTQVSVEGNHWALLGPSTAQLTQEEMGLGKESLSCRTFSDEDRLIQWMVHELMNEKILGLFQGRMEFGPRALGSRSILADPRVAAMKDKLNLRVKHREPFRPFAASVLFEEQENWFSHSFYSPSMEAVFEVKPSKRTKIPAVVHVDHSCRIQSVERETQPFYYKLIQAFFKKTGIPMLLNTSFNDCEPIVCTPKDAIRCFMECEMDHLVIGLNTVSRSLPAVAKAG